MKKLNKFFKVFTFINSIIFLLLFIFTYDDMLKSESGYNIFPTLFFGCSVLVVAVFTNKFVKLANLINFFFLINLAHSMNLIPISNHSFLIVTIGLSVIVFLTILIKYHLLIQLFTEIKRLKE